MTLLELFHGNYVHQRRVRVLTREIAALLPAAGTVLDVGCGDGLLANRLQELKPSLKVTGIDVLVRSNTRIPVTKFDGIRIPFSSGAFDSVMFVDVLHHSANPEELLREAARVTRQSVIIKDHTLEGFAAAACLRFMDRVGNRRHRVALPHTYWPKAAWVELLPRLGLHVREWKSTLHLYPFPADWILGRSLHFLTRTTLSPSEG